MHKLDGVLQHHGVKGMKWGVRKSKDLLKSEVQRGMKHVKLKNYKGKTYFISEHNMNGKTLIPRVPQNYFTKNGHEDSTTNRVSFAPSVDKALMGLSQNVTGKRFYVHEPLGKHDIYKPNNKAVPDADVTGELWIKDPVKLKTVGEILATGDAGKPGKSFKYGDNTAELYEFNYEWTTKHGGVDMHELNQLLKQSGLDDVLLHYGVKGMKWDKEKVNEEVDDAKKKAKQMADGILKDLGIKKKPKIEKAAEAIGLKKKSPITKVKDGANNTLKDLGIKKESKTEKLLEAVGLKKKSKTEKVVDAVNKKLKDSGLKKRTLGDTTNDALMAIFGPSRNRLNINGVEYDPKTIKPLNKTTKQLDARDEKIRSDAQKRVEKDITRTGKKIKKSTNNLLKDIGLKKESKVEKVAESVGLKKKSKTDKLSDFIDKNLKVKSNKKTTVTTYIENSPNKPKGKISNVKYKSDKTPKKKPQTVPSMKDLEKQGWHLENGRFVKKKKK